MFDNHVHKAAVKHVPKPRTQRTLWNGSSPRSRKVRRMRKVVVTSVSVMRGPVNQTRKTGPSPDRKGGLLRDVPASRVLTPGNTNAAPIKLATAGQPKWLSDAVACKHAWLILYIQCNMCMLLSMAVDRLVERELEMYQIPGKLALGSASRSPRTARSPELSLPTRVHTA